LCTFIRSSRESLKSRNSSFLGGPGGQPTESSHRATSMLKTPGSWRMAGTQRPFHGRGAACSGRATRTLRAMAT